MEKDIINELKEALAAKKMRECRLYVEDMDAADVAELFEELDDEEAILLFRLLGKEAAADVFSYLSPEMQEVLVNAITDAKLGNMLSEMYLDDAVDFLEEMPAGVVTRVLANIEPARRDLINQFLKYPENSAGSIMTNEYVAFKEDISVAEAFTRLRKTAFNKETVYTCYITDKNRRLLGEVSVKDLLMASDDDTISELMEDVHYINTHTDREEVAALFDKYDLIATPVVDMESRLVGFITIDDIVDVLKEEVTEDIEKMNALHPSEKPYLKTGVFTLTKNRIIWLMFLMLSGMITGSILAKFEHAFALVPALVTYIPMLTDTGGNAGSQASTLIIRGMAIGEIAFSDFFRVLFKELRVSLICGTILAVINYLKIVIFTPDAAHPEIPFVLAISTLITVILAKTIGSMLPLAAKFLKADPALMASPLITTIVDAAALMIYFTIAKRALGI